jgi:hypothetical protein
MQAKAMRRELSFQGLKLPAAMCFKQRGVLDPDRQRRG